MSKYLLIILSLLLLIHHRQAHSEIIIQQNVHCVFIKDAAKELAQAGEQTQFILANDLRDGKSSIIMTMNPQTGAWTILEITESLACIVGFGKTVNS